MKEKSKGSHSDCGFQVGQRILRNKESLCWQREKDWLTGVLVSTSPNSGVRLQPSQCSLSRLKLTFIVRGSMILAVGWRQWTTFWWEALCRRITTCYSHHSKVVTLGTIPVGYMASCTRCTIAETLWHFAAEEKGDEGVHDMDEAIAELLVHNEVDDWIVTGSRDWKKVNGTPSHLNAKCLPHRFVKGPNNVEKISR